MRCEIPHAEYAWCRSSSAFRAVRTCAPRAAVSNTGSRGCSRGYRLGSTPCSCRRSDSRTSLLSAGSMSMYREDVPADVVGLGAARVQVPVVDTNELERVAPSGKRDRRVPVASVGREHGKRRGIVQRVAVERVLVADLTTSAERCFAAVPASLSAEAVVVV